MTSPSTSRDGDLEAQQLGGDEFHEMKILPPEKTSDTGKDTGGPSAVREQLVDSQAIGGEDVTHETNIDQSERDNTARQIPTQVEHGEATQSGVEPETQHVVDHNLGGPLADNSSPEPRMIGDFNGSSNALWNLYGKEAKSHDEARIQPLKEDMDGVLIFAGLFSAALTSFVVDSKQNLQAKPTDQIVYYLEQHSTILSQISQQIASIAPQVSIPSTPPSLFPRFNPSASDIRINAFWFMALAFSLSAALLAILVQQWVRDYMHVFQRYSDPQKSARMRQYLYEGSEGWYMPIVAEAVPGLLHVSLFLFFAGLGDSTLNINTTIGMTTTIPIGMCGLLYIFTTFAPVIYPQSPYQTSFSGLIWYAIQKSRGRIFKDWDGESKPVSTNMAQGQMQLSMEETKERKGRDMRAIRWLFDNLTEDAEIESFVMAIPGSFKGLEVWADWSKEDNVPVVTRPLPRSTTIRNVLGLIPRQFRTSIRGHSPINAMVHRPELNSASIHRPIITTYIHEKNTIRELCRRIGHLFDTCKNRAVFASDELWRRRARVCVEAMALLVSNAGAELDWFGDTLQVLGDIGIFEGINSLSFAERDQAFVVRWTCLSIMAIRPTLRSNLLSKDLTFSKMIWFVNYTDQDEKAQRMDDTLEHRWATEREWRLSSKISFAADRMLKFDGVDSDTDSLDETIDKLSQRLIRQLPGVHFDFPDSEPFLRQTLDLFCDPSKLRFISSRQSPNKFLDYLNRIDDHQDASPNSNYEQVAEKVVWPKHLLQRRLWSLQDLRYGGGLGFAVELFLLSLRKLLSTYPSHESYSALYIATFRAITSDWSKYTYSVGTQNLLLDAVESDQGFLRTFNYPDYITDELRPLVGLYLPE